ncbi:hypothetical protein HRbin06_00720 [archaeon HR06]|nr:hypothetical protein HRbin06_00720 [archaeon HR06]
MSWIYDKDREKILELIYLNQSYNGITLNHLINLSGLPLNQLKRILRDLERAGFIEQVDWRRRYKVTEEGKFRLNGKNHS